MGDDRRRDNQLRDIRYDARNSYSYGYSGSAYQAVEKSVTSSGGFRAFLDKAREVTGTVLKVGAVVVGGMIVLGAAGQVMQDMSSGSEADKGNRKT